MTSITIKDVAQRAGVSIKTVSRVLNRERHVRQHTRDEVLAAVEALSYVPNVSARALAGSRTYLIGLYFDDPTPAYVSQAEQGAMNACRQFGYHLIVGRLQRKDEDFAEQVASLGDHVRVDGSILTPPLCDELTLLDVLDASGSPYVRLSPTVDPGRSPSVQFDDYGAAYAMTGELIALGHRDIAFISGPVEHIAAYRRQQGFVQAMRDAGLSVAPNWLERGDFHSRSGWLAGERLLAAQKRPTAIFAGNDEMALGVMAVANRLHLDIPSHLSLVGFDDTPSAEAVWPQLTTVRQPVSEMARAAATLLMEPADDGDRMAVRMLDFTLVFRDSAGPPPR
jgi:LacI family transcriptional regulator